MFACFTGLCIISDIAHATIHFRMLSSIDKWIAAADLDHPCQERVGEPVPDCNGQCVQCIGMHVCFFLGVAAHGTSLQSLARISCDMYMWYLRVCSIIPQFDTLCAPMGVLLQTTCFCYTCLYTISNTSLP